MALVAQSEGRGYVLDSMTEPCDRLVVAQQAVEEPVCEQRGGEGFGAEHQATAEQLADNVLDGLSWIPNPGPQTAALDSEADVMLYAPTRGSGMKVKVLEAFALGVPVVTNQDGVEGLMVGDRVHADVTDDDAELIDRTVALLQDPGLRARRAAAARTLVEQQCAPSRVLDILDTVYQSVLQD